MHCDGEDVALVGPDDDEVSAVISVTESIDRQARECRSVFKTNATIRRANDLQQGEVNLAGPVRVLRWCFQGENGSV